MSWSRPPWITSLPSPGSQVNESRPLPSSAVSVPRLPSTLSLPAPIRNSSLPLPPNAESLPSPVSMIVNGCTSAP
ncbi:hypothetical protein E0H73_12955 [Kribbella pittospori]|uniref:Uncharacterized protein n=1 Tax=Kribbella pittospori TaxID=722689 RepID=A0A4R0KSE5_9ACTN|nr:hypothetical protein E0H73_12955 [Kribbella pittospori]